MWMKGDKEMTMMTSRERKGDHFWVARRFLMTLAWHLAAALALAVVANRAQTPRDETLEGDLREVEK